MNLFEAIANFFNGDNTPSAAYALSHTEAPGNTRDIIPVRYTTERELATVGYVNIATPSQAVPGADQIPPWLTGSLFTGVLNSGGAPNNSNNPFADIFGAFNNFQLPGFTSPVSPPDVGPIPGYNPVGPTVTPFPNAGRPSTLTGLVGDIYTAPEDIKGGGGVTNVPGGGFGATPYITFGGGGSGGGGSGARSINQF